MEHRAEREKERESTIRDRLLQRQRGLSRENIVWITWRIPVQEILTPKISSLLTIISIYWRA